MADLRKRLNNYIRGDIDHIISAIRIPLENFFLQADSGPYSQIEEECWVDSPGGNSIYCHVHRPAKRQRWPGIVLVPSGLQSGSIFDKWFALNITASDLASRGYAVVHFDPQGRGRTPGEEDFGGGAQQADLNCILSFFAELDYVDPDSIGIASFSLGISIACGTLANYSGNVRVRYLFDWEGPTDRYEITLHDSHVLFKNYPTSNDEFWNLREAINHIGRIRCGYFRYQCRKDHVHKEYKEHALKMVNAASSGSARWVRLNNITVGSPIRVLRLTIFD